MKKIIILLVGYLVIFTNAHAQEITEFGFMRILPGISEIPTTIIDKGSSCDVLMLLVTVSTNDTDTVGKKSYKAYIPNTPDNREILKQEKPFFIDTKKRILRNDDWVEPKDQDEGYLLIYAWGQLKPWDPKYSPTIADMEQFGYVRLDHVVRWEISVEFKFGFFKGKERVDMFQVLITNRVVSGNKITFNKTVVYHLKNEHNEKLFAQTYSFFVNFDQITRSPNGWADPVNFKGKLIPFIFNWGSIHEIRFATSPQKRNSFQQQRQSGNREQQVPLE